MQTNKEKEVTSDAIQDEARLRSDHGSPSVLENRPDEETEKPALQGEVLKDLENPEVTSGKGNNNTNGEKVDVFRTKDTEKSIAPRNEAASLNPEKGDRIEKDTLNGGKNYSPHTYNPSSSSDLPQTSREDPTLVSDEDHSNKQSLRRKETRQSQRKGVATKDSKKFSITFLS